MLVLWTSLLVPKDQDYLRFIDPYVQYWPCSYYKGGGYSSCVPIEWWISFSQEKYGIYWLISRGQYSKVVYRE